MIARPPPSYEWTLHPGLTDYGAVCTLWGHTRASDTDADAVDVKNEEVEDDDTDGADVEVQRGKIEGDAETNG